MESIPGLSKKAQNRRSSSDVEGIRCHQKTADHNENTQGERWEVVSRKKPSEVEKKCKEVEKRDKEIEKRDKQNEDSDEEPLFITQLLERWSPRRPIQENIDNIWTQGSVWTNPILQQGEAQGGFAQPQDKRIPLRGHETHRPLQNCLLSEKLKAAKGFVLSGEVRPWLCHQQSSQGRGGCWRCRHCENEQQNFLRFYREREMEVRRQHAESSGKLESGEKTRATLCFSKAMSWREQSIRDYEMVNGDNISPPWWREQIRKDSLASSSTGFLPTNPRGGDNDLAKPKKVVNAENFSPGSSPPPRLTKTAERKFNKFRQLKHWKPSLPVIIEDGTEADGWQCEADNLSKGIFLREEIVRLRREILGAKAKNLSLKILNLVITRLSKIKEKQEILSSPLNPNAKEWKPPCPLKLKEPGSCSYFLLKGQAGGSSSSSPSSPSIRPQLKKTIIPTPVVNTIHTWWPCQKD